ncbi:MAG: two-component hybrid sensor and regulator, partial [Labilithrix sp.]|nr:two-component hybrid sensor and regulator [Labilithrix sp.]
MDTFASTTLTLRERVMLELARRDKSDIHDTFQAITEAAAVVLDVARVSIWALVDGGGPPGTRSELDKRIVCKDLYLLDENKHVSFMPIHGHDFPSYLRALHERRSIAADDAQNDPRTMEFTNFYLKPLGIASMLDIPIFHRGDVYGVLCFEHVGATRRWTSDEQSFAIHMADIAASCLQAADLVTLGKRWEIVIESLSEGVALLDTAGKALHCNRAMRRNFIERNGVRTWDELLEAVDLVDAADRRLPGSDWPFQRVLRREKIDGEIYGLVFKRNGDRRYVRLTCSPVLEDGQVKLIVFVMVDATEEMFVERLKSELLSNVAHELKTPLAIAKGYAQQLESTKTPPPNRLHMLDAIVRACDRMDHLSETLLDLASMILGRLRLTRERIDLAELALSVVRRSERAAPSHRFQIETRPNIPVAIDSTRIAQAMRHILDNAVAYSAPGSPIEVELKTDGSNVTVAVRDHGIGIPKDAQKSLFTLFFKAHAGT